MRLKSVGVTKKSNKDRRQVGRCARVRGYGDQKDAIKVLGSNEEEQKNREELGATPAHLMPIFYQGSGFR